MTCSNNVDAAQRLFFTLIPLTQVQCGSCGRDPRNVFDSHNQFIDRYDDAATLDERGHCADCAAMRNTWNHTKMMKGRK